MTRVADKKLILLLIIGALLTYQGKMVCQTPAEQRTDFFIKALNDPEGAKALVNSYKDFENNRKKQTYYEIYKALGSLVNADKAIAKRYEGWPQSEIDRFTSVYGTPNGLQYKTYTSASGGSPGAFSIMAGLLEGREDVLNENAKETLSNGLFFTFVNFRSKTRHQGSLLLTRMTAYYKMLFAEPASFTAETYQRFFSLIMSADDLKSSISASLDDKEIHTATQKVVYIFQYTPLQKERKKVETQASDRYIAFIRTPEKEKVKALILNSNGEDLSTLERTYHNQYGNFFSNQTNTTPGYFFEKLWQPVYEELEGLEQVAVFAQGLYSKIPLNSLVHRDGSINSDHQVYQIFDPLHQTTGTKQHRKKGRDNRDFVLIGNPEFSETSQLSAADTLFINGIITDLKTNGNRPRNLFDDFLSGAEYEATTLNKLLTKQGYEGSFNLRKDATVSVLKTMNAPWLLHIAAHFRSEIKSMEGGIFADPFLYSGPKMPSLELAGKKPDYIKKSKLLVDSINVYYDKIRKRINESDYSEPDQSGEYSDKKVNDYYLQVDRLQNQYSKLADPFDQLAKDNIFSIQEVQSLSLSSTELVVLSGCSTANPYLGDEEVFNLVDAFRSAGAGNVLASLWEVDDTATAILMVRFYEYWFDGEPMPLSLVKAQRDVRSVPGFEDPYFWAGWILYGKG